MNFFQILLSRPEYLKSKTLQHIIKDASLKKKKQDKSELGDSYSGEFSDIDKIITLHYILKKIRYSNKLIIKTWVNRNK